MDYLPVDEASFAQIMKHMSLDDLLVWYKVTKGRRFVLEQIMETAQATFPNKKDLALFYQMNGLEIPLKRTLKDMLFSIVNPGKYDIEELKKGKNRWINGDALEEFMDFFEEAAEEYLHELQDEVVKDLPVDEAVALLIYMAHEFVDSYLMDSLRKNPGVMEKLGDMAVLLYEAFNVDDIGAIGDYPLVEKIAHLLIDRLAVTQKFLQTTDKHTLDMIQELIDGLVSYLEHHFRIAPIHAKSLMEDVIDRLDNYLIGNILLDILSREFVIEDKFTDSFRIESIELSKGRLDFTFFRVYYSRDFHLDKYVVPITPMSFFREKPEFLWKYGIENNEDEWLEKALDLGFKYKLNRYTSRSDLSRYRELPVEFIIRAMPDKVNDIPVDYIIELIITANTHDMKELFVLVKERYIPQLSLNEKLHVVEALDMYEK